MFNFPSVKGNPADIFKDRNSIIITDEAAQKLFGGQNPIGQMTNQGQVIRAVVTSPKNKSHIPFEAIGNIDSFSPELKNGDYKSRNYLYGRIAENTDPETIEARLANIPTRFTNDVDNNQREHSFFLQSINGIMFKDGIFNEIGSSVGREGLIMFVALTLTLLNQIQTEWESIFIDGNFQATFLNSQIDSTFENLLNAIRIISFIGGCIILISMLGQLGMALFNAQSRMKEIGIRKVMGAAMGRIIGLILKSTIITIIIAAFISTPVAYLVFKYAVAADVRTPLEITPWLLLKGVLVLTTLVVGVVISQTWKVASANPTQSLRNE